MKLIGESKGRINAEYNMHLINMNDIYKNNNGPFEMIHDSFRFGYMQGMKAAKAEMRKGGAANG